MEHPLADILRAIAEGKEVQFFNGVNWITKVTIGDVVLNMHGLYRVKPDTKKYRVYEYKAITGKLFLNVISTERAATTVAEQEDFIRWISDWVEYESLD